MGHVLLEKVVKHYGDVQAVKSVDLEIRDKEFMVFVGPSGCGKSTLLRMIAGLEDITGGKISIDGVCVNDMPPKNRDISMVFQNYALYPHMNIYENMAFALKLRKMPKEQIDAKVRSAAKMLGIENLLDRRPGQISGGQRQRVALGRSVVREPRVFLMDEPLSNLDAKLRVQMRAELKLLHQRLQTTFIYVTHDQVEAMTMGDRLVVLRDGIIQQVDSPLTLYNKPANLFVAGFIGSPAMNNMRGRLTRVEGKLKVVSDCGASLTVAPEHDNELLQPYINKTVVLGIRPEHINDAKLMKNLPADAENVITTNVRVTELLGSETMIFANAFGSDMIAKVDSETKSVAGDAITLWFDMKKAHFFDAETEKSIFFPART